MRRADELRHGGIDGPETAPTVRRSLHVQRTDDPAETLDLPTARVYLLDATGKRDGADRDGADADQDGADQEP